MTNPVGRPLGKKQPHLVIWPGILRLVRLGYTRMRAQCKFRDEEFTLTWPEFQAIWEGKWELRGSNIDSYCLSRIDWDGVWSADNIQIITRLEHFRLQRQFTAMNRTKK